MKRVAVIFLSCVFWVSCSHEVTHEVEKEQIEFTEEDIIHPLTFSEPNLFNVSFPNWFNPTMVAEKAIDSVYLDVYLLDWKSDSTFKKELDYSFAYNFTSEGCVKKVQFMDYYELAQILKVSFFYPTPPDSLGYSLPRIEKVKSTRVGKKGAQLFRTASDLQRFNRLEFKVGPTGSLNFVNTTSIEKEMHIYISNAENQNILFVDKLETNKEDVFYYGLPLQYEKAFGLTDLVNEDVLAEFKFYENTTFPSRDKRSEQGLNLKGTYIYSPKGLWLAKNDSVFTSTGDFVKLLSTEMVRSDRGLLSEVRFLIGATPKGMRVNKIIEVNYVFRKD